MRNESTLHKGGKKFTRKTKTSHEKCNVVEFKDLFIFKYYWLQNDIPGTLVFVGKLKMSHIVQEKY